MKYRIKFISTEVVKTINEGNKVKLTAVEPFNECKLFRSNQPRGTIELQNVKSEMLDKFEPGNMFFVDFIEAE